MKKNIFKKIVASLATVAMAAGLFTAMPAEEAKAAETTEMVVYLSDSSNVKNVLLDISDWGGGASLKPAGEKTDISWGRDLYAFTQDPTNKDKWTISVEGKLDLEGKVDLANDDWCNMQIVIVPKTGDVFGGKYFMANDQNNTDNKLTNAEQWNANSVLYYSIDVSKGWHNVTASTKDPMKIDATGVIESIDAIGTVELKDECKAKIEAAESAYDSFIKVGGDKADVTNYDKLTAAKAKYDELKAAKEAADAGKLTVYVKNADWTKMNVYGWGGAEFGTWPGKALTPLKANEGWFSVSFDITKATNLIFNDGTTQTVDWKNVSAGTYWLVLSEKVQDGDKEKYSVDNVSTTKPDGWKDEAAEEIENKEPVTDKAPETGKTPETNKTPETEAKKGVTVEVTLSADAKWDKVFLYAWGGDAKVEWPGIEMTAKNGKWYATIDTTATKLSYVISNGDKEQTVDIKDVEGKDVKITLGAKNADGKFEASAKTVTGSAKPGDAAPIVMMFAVAAVAAGMVIASKKKTICE